MSSRGVAKASLALAIVMLVASVAGFITTLVLNTFVLDKYNAYGEVPIPGSGSVHLPTGEVSVSLHTLVIGGNGGTGLPLPPLGISINPPEGVPQPTVTERIGSTTTVNNDAHVRVWVVDVPVEATYNVMTEGQVGGYINPRLAFGHQSSSGWLVWIFVAMFVVGLIDLALSVMWLARARRAAASALVNRPYLAESPTASVRPGDSPGPAYEPGEQGIRLERLKTLAALRDSGALTEDEFQAEKRRILDGR
ncbi:hypothetical protein MB901379_03025 [Mycobacterium basiliense]|uniref:SHOCT domain-containing protein n=1 Tax=Mycobacterium basiliense TaxID=2094119 RepID=A0A3S4FNX0_9MYCO|nr:SHOCT domain-containing protein [Mycobacterium basiliense]VDM89448.1 hypothetical protein MB901379_03025 [Mycobacterium basiliense]